MPGMPGLYLYYPWRRHGRSALRASIDTPKQWKAIKRPVRERAWKTLAFLCALLAAAVGWHAARPRWRASRIEVPALAPPMTSIGTARARFAERRDPAQRDSQRAQ